MSSRVNVRSLGRFARAALFAGEAAVISVFERSAYVETCAGLACVGVVGNGPLNAECGPLPAGIRVGDMLGIGLSDARPWVPRRAPAWTPQTVVGSLDLLQSMARTQLPTEGFGYVLDSARDRPSAVYALSTWISQPRGLPEDAGGLLGLGPGLTPSGDDLIGGALCAVRAAGFAETADQLAAWALPIARGGATNRISYAHLACAAEGEAAEAVNDAIVALLAGEAPDLARIDSIGHTSGWDALAGVALALHAALRTPRVT